MNTSIQSSGVMTVMINVMIVSQISTPDVSMFSMECFVYLYVVIYISDQCTCQCQLRSEIISARRSVIVSDVSLLNDVMIEFNDWTTYTANSCLRVSTFAEPSYCLRYDLLRSCYVGNSSSVAVFWRHCHWIPQHVTEYQLWINDADDQPNELQNADKTISQV